MAIITNQHAIVGASSQSAINVPGGSTVLVLSAPSTNADPVYVGTSSNVTATNGLALNAGSPPITIPGFPGSGSTTIWVIGTAGDVISWAISTTG